MRCGIKPSGNPDLALIVGDGSFAAAGVYTRNQIVAAPVVLCRDRTPSSSIRAVVVNSGNANACTGEQGDRDAAAMCRQVADLIGADESEVLVMSTGIIGQHLPMDAVSSGISEAAASLGGADGDFLDASDAILTTDKGRKVASGTVDIDGTKVRVAAMAKGAGMIAPDMATMLGVVMTDADLEPQLAQGILRSIAADSFNRVSVDGHTSTNDTLLMLSSGASTVKVTPGNQAEFVELVRRLCVELAVKLVADGEGATRVMKIHVRGADSDDDADTIARAIGESPLVKTAITGCDPNWGRIVSAAGYAGGAMNPRRTSLRLCGVSIYKGGVPEAFNEAALSATMKSCDIVDVDLIVGDGRGTATRWASDLTVDYVRFNSEYTT